MCFNTYRIATSNNKVLLSRFSQILRLLPSRVKTTVLKGGTFSVKNGSFVIKGKGIIVHHLIPPPPASLHPDFFPLWELGGGGGELRTCTIVLQEEIISFKPRDMLHFKTFFWFLQDGKLSLSF